MTRQFSVAAIPGDGIGLEIVPAARPVVDAAAGRHDATIEWTDYDWGSDHYRRTGSMMPADGLEQLGVHEAIFFGAVGDPEISDVTTLWGLLIPMRRTFEQYVNVRPARSVPGVPTPLAGTESIDMVIIRENVEGEYSEVGGVTGEGTEDELATQVASFSRRGISRVTRFAAELALRRSGGLVSATKSNGIIHTMPYWDRIVQETVVDFPGVRLRSVLIDALCAELVRRPRSSTSSSPPTCSATSSPTSRRHASGRSGWPRRPTSIPSASTPRRSSPCTARPPTSRAGGSPIRWPRSARAR